MLGLIGELGGLLFTAVPGASEDVMIETEFTYCFCQPDREAQD